MTTAAVWEFPFRAIRTLFTDYPHGALFNTYGFLLVFLPACLVGYWAVRSRTWKLAWLTAASFVFYSFYDVRFTGLLVAAAVVDFVVAQRLEGSEGRVRTRWLVLSIVFNLGLLGVFKYAVFAAATARSIFDVLGLPIQIPGFSIALPVGISFFTFKTMSYTIDVYRREVPATRNLLKYLAFVSLFPELVAGPIVRYSVMDRQMDTIPERLDPSYRITGISLLTLGLAKKVLIADSIAQVVDPIWQHAGTLTSVEAWTGALGYTFQLYFDFSGYSDMAIGLAALLGFNFPINFRAPYQARNPSDFWGRWHITLSTFLRDYLYIPLGGNRCSPLRVRFNLMVVMLLGGLWHGAAWTFVLWGAYHGLLLVLYQTCAPWWDRRWVWMQRVATFLLVVFGWVLFLLRTLVPPSRSMTECSTRST